MNIKQKQDRNVRSNDVGLPLSQTCIKHKTFASRSFKYAAAYIWNQLPKHLRDTKELPQFKKLLKTHLFKIAFAELNIKKHTSCKALEKMTPMCHSLQHYIKSTYYFYYYYYHWFLSLTFRFLLFAMFC